VRILLVKLSSFGDLIHTFPAVSELKSNLPNIHLDWLVDASYSAIPSWHPGVDEVLELPIRKRSGKRDWQGLIQAHKVLRTRHYDSIIDAQGLIKSSLSMIGVKGTKHGFATPLLKEPLARFNYHHQHEVEVGHVIDKNRQLLASVFNYPLSPSFRFGIENNSIIKSNQVVFFIGSSWHNKRWPLSHWHQLVKKAINHGLHVVMPWGSQKEKDELLIFNSFPSSKLTISSYSLNNLKNVLESSRAVIAADTGVLHLAQAVNTPVLGLFGPTDGMRSGPGSNALIQSKESCAPCMRRKCKFNDSIWAPCMISIDPDNVWSRLLKVMD
jgi:heptosyltransferase I